MPAGAKVIGVKELQQKTAKFATQAPKINQKLVGDIALSAKGILLAEASGEGIRTMSRFANGRGVRLGIQYRIRERDGIVSALVQPVPPGPWYLAEYGGPAHQIGRRSNRRRGPRGQAGFLGRAGTDMHAVGPVNHPEAKARHTWKKGAALSVAAGRRLYSTAGRRAYAQLLRG